MRALVHTAAGDTSVLAFRDVPRPEPGSGQVRVRVHAAGLNRADILQRLGRYPAPPGWPADIPGLEYAGTVDAAGAGVTRWKPGDRVMGIVGGGAHAEFVVVHQNEVLAMPAGMDFAEAAAIPEAFLTAWDALVVRARIRPGERLLVHAAASGLGTAAVQVGKFLGARVAGTSRTKAKLEQAAALGLDQLIVRGGTAPEPLGSSTFDVILDVLGGPAFQDNLEALAPLGRLVLLGFLQGGKFDGTLDPILRKRAEVIGTLMRPRTLEERVPLVERFGREVLPHVGTRLRPVVGARFPMADVARAHAAMEAGEVFGKIVLLW
jgi:NADPH2:quinone reductase